MDDLDCSILCHLCKNIRVSTTEIAQKLGVAPSTVHNRINRKESGITEQFTAIFDPAAVGQNVTRTSCPLYVDRTSRRPQDH